MDYLSLRPS